MAASRGTCPACGEPVYGTDDVCMSCGAELRAGRPTPPPAGPVGPAPGPPPPPTPALRAPVAKPWYHKVVESCGRLWDIYPWVGIALYVCGGIFFAQGMPIAFAWVISIIYLLWQCGFIFWLIVDVLYFGSERYWIVVAWFPACYPFGLLFYLLRGR